MVRNPFMKNTGIFKGDCSEISHPRTLQRSPKRPSVTSLNRWKAAFVLPQITASTSLPAAVSLFRGVEATSRDPSEAMQITRQVKRDEIK